MALILADAAKSVRDFQQRAGLGVPVEAAEGSGGHRDQFVAVGKRSDAGEISQAAGVADLEALSAGDIPQPQRVVI